MAENFHTVPIHTEAGPSTTYYQPVPSYTDRHHHASAIPGLQQGWPLRYSLVLQTRRKKWVALCETGEQEAVSHPCDQQSFSEVKCISYILPGQVVQNHIGAKPGSATTAPFHRRPRHLTSGLGYLLLPGCSLEILAS